MTYRAQQREPKLLMLERRIETYSDLYGRLYEIATCLHQNAPSVDTMRRIAEFRSAVLRSLLYVDPKTRAKVLAVYNFLMGALDKKEIRIEDFQGFLNEATSALVDGITIDYK